MLSQHLLPVLTDCLANNIKQPLVQVCVCVCVCVVVVASIDTHCCARWAPHNDGACPVRPHRCAACTC